MLEEGREVAARSQPRGSSPDGSQQVAAGEVAAALAKLENVIRRIKGKFAERLLAEKMLVCKASFDLFVLESVGHEACKAELLAQIF